MMGKEKENGKGKGKGREKSLLIITLLFQDLLTERLDSVDQEEENASLAALCIS